MGCCASVPVVVVNVAIIPVCDGKPERLMISEVENPIVGGLPQTQGMMNPYAMNKSMQQEHKVQKEGVILQHACEQANQNMELLCVVPKFDMPRITRLEGRTVMMMKNGTILVYRPLAAGQSVETVTVKEQQKVSTAHVSKGTMKVVNGTAVSASNTDVQTGMDQTIVNHGTQGYRLKGGSMVSMSSQMQMGGQGRMTPTIERHQTSETKTELELVFQKLHDPNRPAPTEAVLASYQITKTLITASGGGVGGMMQMQTDMPDIIGHLNEQGREGWELASLLAMPPEESMTGSHENRAFTTDVSQHTRVTTVPVMALLERRPEATPIKYTSYTYTFRQGGFPVSMKGDLTPVILAHAERGWILKGAIQLPPGVKDGAGSAMSMYSGGMQMKVILFFAENDQRREYV
jgi:hypothetical protein